jgi:UDP-glucuronate 4-epimerase
MINGLEQALSRTATIDWLPDQPGDLTQTWASISKARSLLGYAPRTTYAEGSRRFVDWFRYTESR